MNLVYVYDGSPEGFLCCIYESFARKEIPDDIQTERGQTMLGETVRTIRTDEDISNKVYFSIREKIGSEAQDFIKKAFLSDLRQKEILLYRLICRGYKRGASIFNDLTEDTVYALTTAVRQIERETHHYLGFIRFSEVRGILVSEIAPSGRVLPLVKQHFADRFPDEVFIIMDKTHREALLHRPGQECLFATVDKDFSVSQGDDYRIYEELWKCFHESISIEQRRNDTCQRNHLPKKFRPYMTEFTVAKSPQSDFEIPETRSRHRYRRSPLEGRVE